MSLAAVAVAALLLSSAQDGRWAGRIEGSAKAPKVTFQVARDGHRIKRFRTTITAFCVGPTLETNRFVVFVVSIPRVRVRSDHHFSATYQPNGKDNGKYLASGTLRGTRVRNGQVEVKVSTCAGRAKWTAHRRSS